MAGTTWPRRAARPPSRESGSPIALTTAKDIFRIRRLRVPAAAVTVAAACLLATSLSHAGPAKVPKVGYCWSFGIREHVFYHAFVRGLRERGWEDGKNVRILVPEGTVKPDGRVAGSCNDYMADKGIDVLVGDEPLGTIPRVRIIGGAASSDLEKSPTRNVTGLTFGTLDDLRAVNMKRMQLLKEAFGARYIVSISAGSADFGPTLRGLGKDNDVPEAYREASRKLDVTPASATFTSHEDLEPTFRAIAARPHTALLFNNSMHWYAIRKNGIGVDEYIEKYRLPTMFAQADWAQVKTGAQPDANVIISYGPSYIEICERFAYFVDRILRGARPADLPFEQLPYRLALNLDAAKRWGITIPQSVILQADILVPYDPMFTWFGPAPPRPRGARR